MKIRKENNKELSPLLMILTSYTLLQYCKISESSSIKILKTLLYSGIVLVVPSGPSIL